MSIIQYPAPTQRLVKRRGYVYFVLLCTFDNCSVNRSLSQYERVELSLLLFRSETDNETTDCTSNTAIHVLNIYLRRSEILGLT